MTIRIGIQGGRGSFNEEACLSYLKLKSIADYSINYLYTSQKVFEALENKLIDLGQCAIYNNHGGIVTETIGPMGNHLFEFIDEFRLNIQHHLMIHPEACIEEITTIMTHPQVFLQCSRNLTDKYSKLNQTHGEGDLIDSGRVAEFISLGKLEKNIAVCGSKNLALAHNLKIVESNLQDFDDNRTSFIWVKKVA